MIKDIVNGVVVIVGIIVLIPIILAQIVLEKIRNSNEEEKE